MDMDNDRRKSKMGNGIPVTDPGYLGWLGREYFGGEFPDDLRRDLNFLYGRFYVSPAFPEIMRRVAAHVRRYANGELDPPFPVPWPPRVRLTECGRDDLIELLIHHVKQQRLEIAALRHAVSLAIGGEAGEYIRDSILYDLHGYFESAEAYLAFINKYYEGVDPVGHKPFMEMLRRLADGEEIPGLPFFPYASWFRPGRDAT